MMEYPFDIIETKKGILVKFTKNNILLYLDWAIENWRKKREEAGRRGDEKEILIAECYIDAYQSIRKSLFGTIKKGG